MASDCARVYERVESCRETGFFDLSSCKLTQIPNGVLMVLKSSRDPDVDPPITRCSVANNLLKNLPSKLIKEEILFGGLEALDLSANKISQLPAEIEKMKQLTELNLAENKFEFLPEIVWSLPEMKSVSFAGNGIASVNVTRIRDASKLKRLDLSKNPIEETVKAELLAFAEEKGVSLLL